MALLEYFQKKDVYNALLPDPCGPVGKEIGKKHSEEANKEVTPVLVGGSSCSLSCQKHKLYIKLTPEQKAIVAKYATEHGLRICISTFQITLI